MSHSYRRSNAAFTLVELLVVVTVISVLISLLVPAIAQSKEMARRSVCLSNLRQQAIAAAQYADTYKEVIPVGYTAGYKQFNYMIFYDEANPGQTRPFCWGLFVTSGLLPASGAYYCPSTTSPYLQFNTAVNPCLVWPVTTSSQTGLRGGYSTRPTTNWDHPNSSGWYPVAPAPWPKRNALAGMALAMDVVNDSASLTYCHVTGGNVAYENGSARFIPVRVFQTAGLATIGSAFSVGENSKLDALWTAMDKN